MALAAGTRLGPYEILSPLGAGGMGEVYKARDTRLERIVAVKVLPSHMSSSPEVRQRFEREAKTISQLSHPHICALYDVGREGETEYLVMEYLEGETLSDRLGKGALPLEQTLRYGVEIADALDKAHRQGIVHRDLKPGNVMLTKSGVKLLDFGLAKAIAPATPQSSLTALPTQQDLTQEGTILGTFQYMAPEQLEGKEADARTDIFAFGATLYEMATGKKAFSATTQASLITAIMSADPPAISAVQPMSPAALDRVAKKCLAKDPEDRWQNAADLGSELKWIGESGSEAGVAAPIVSRRKSRERVAWVAAALAALLAAALAVLLWRRPEPPRRVLQFTVSPPEKSTFGESFALSPDGSELVFEAAVEGKILLWLRPLNSIEARPIPGTEGASFPFWSPDGRYLGFFADGKLKKVAVSGGPAQALADASATRGGAWSPAGVILFAPDVTSALMRVSAAGGAVSAVTSVDRTAGEIGHRWPVFLPDGNHFLFLARNMRPDKEAICFGSLSSQKKKVLLRSRSRPVYAAPGYLLYSGEHALLAQPFDLSTARLFGEPVLLAENIAPIGESGPTGYVRLSASADGILAFRREAVASRKLAWYDRSGRALGNVGPVGDYSEVALSPDGTRLALVREDPKTRSSDIWTFDLARAVFTRLTFDPSDHVQPLWSPDGKSIVYASSRSGTYNLYGKPASGGGQEEVLLKSDNIVFLGDWSRDGRFLIYESLIDPKAQLDLWVAPMPGPGKSFPYVVADSLQRRPRFSPDGHWVAYRSDESGRPEVYVQAFPATGGKWLISPEGGDQPSWRGDGKEIFYVSPASQIMAVDVKGGETFEIGTPHPLFNSGRTFAEIGSTRSSYAATADGQRFLVIANAENAPPTLITVTVNWTEGLKR